MPADGAVEEVPDNHQAIVDAEGVGPEGARLLEKLEGLGSAVGVKQEAARPRGRPTARRLRVRALATVARPPGQAMGITGSSLMRDTRSGGGTGGCRSGTLDEHVP